MVTAVREIPTTTTRIEVRRTHAKGLSKPNLGVLLLAAIVLLSALAVVYVADLNRRIFMEVQQIQGAQNQLHLDWGKLLLEQSTWSTQARIQALAQERLGMVAPVSASTVIIKI